MDREPLRVEVVSAERQVWAGDVVNIIARTTEGDIGILPGHEPIMAALVPCVVEIVTAAGTSESLAIDGGFISVANGHVWILSQLALMGSEVTEDAARREQAGLQLRNERGELDDAEEHRLHILNAQIRAAERVRAR